MNPGLFFVKQPFWNKDREEGFHHENKKAVCKGGLQ